jgi:prepilin-type N-terminal cleavage/methylation domain-containing protein
MMMRTWRKKRSGLSGNERGFTLPEVLTTVAILGILIAIAMSMWNSVIESRRVDSAANQLASDMRLAHTKATNQLTDWRVVLNPGSKEYDLQRLDGVDGTPDPNKTIDRELPDGTKVLSTSAGANPYLEFNSDGTMAAPVGPSGNVVVSTDDDEPKQNITFISATSRIKLD